MAPSSEQLAANEDAVAEAELDLIVMPERVVHYLTDMGAQEPACGAQDDNGCAYAPWRVTCPACLEEMDDD